MRSSSTTIGRPYTTLLFMEKPIELSDHHETREEPRIVFSELATHSPSTETQITDTVDRGKTFLSMVSETLYL